MKRRTALQIVASVMAPFVPSFPQTRQEDVTTLSGTCTNCMTVTGSPKREKLELFLDLSDIRKIRVSWGESSIEIEPQELWEALHRNE